MDSITLNQSTGDYGPVVAAALARIAESFPEIADRTKGSTKEIIQHGRDYKVEVYGEDDYDLTIYADGSWADSDGREGTIRPLHTNSWVKRMVKAGDDLRMAIFSVEFFKNLKAGR